MDKRIIYIITGAFLLRMLFYIYGAEIYFGTASFSVQGDTYGWMNSILNLIHKGNYTVDLSNENAWFYRPPGYSFFIGFFYLLTGQNLDLALKLIPFAQIVLDTFSVYLIYRVTLKVFAGELIALIVATLYACYPYAIVWTPVIYAETFSIFLLLSSLYFFLNNRRHHLIFAGILLGFAVLTRLQIIFIFPFMLLALWMKEQRKITAGMYLFTMAFLLAYGTWPARNYLLHNRLVFSQDLNIGGNWSPDYLAFMNYVFSIQTDHQPQFDQIVYNRTVEWPEAAYVAEGDSAILASTVILCRQCGKGFSNFMNFRGQRNALFADSLNCDKVIESRFNLLIQHQKKYNALNYYLIVPLKNLQKSLFKMNLYGGKSPFVKTLGAALFLLRTILIFLGLFMLAEFAVKGQFKPFVILISGFFFSWYIYLSFFYRNIEIRYLLHADILLLIPAAYLIAKITGRYAWRHNAAKNNN